MRLAQNENSYSTGQSGEEDLQLNQQLKLTELRLKLCDVVSKSIVHPHVQPDVRRVFNLIAGKPHINQWVEFLPVFEAIQLIGKPYHNCLVILGGWFSDRHLEKAEPPPEDLLKLLGRYRACLYIDAACQRLLTANDEQRHAAEDALMERLAIYWGAKYIKRWRQPAELSYSIAVEKPKLETEIETHFLFLKHKAFVFAPTAKNPTGGWDDFYQFVRTYRELVGKFSTRFGDYFWGIYPPKSSKP